jgi:hypothetical protein
VEEPKIRVSQDYSQFITSLNHNLVSSRTGRSCNVGHTTLREKNNIDFQNTVAHKKLQKSKYPSKKHKPTMIYSVKRVEFWSSIYQTEKLSNSPNITDYKTFDR